MAIKLRRRETRRTYQCDIAGCRNRTNYLISKREDVSSRPLHLCDECIRGLYAMIGGGVPAPDVPTPAPDGGLSINGGAEAVAAQPDEMDTMDWGAVDAAADRDEKPAKAEAKPNRARKKGGVK